MQHWALSTLVPFGERTAIENLDRQGFEAYSPKFMDRKIVRGRVNWQPTPLFSGYLFVLIDNAVDRWRSIFGTKGIASLFVEGDQPCRIRTSEIEKIKANEVNGFVVLPQLPKFKGSLGFFVDDEVIPRRGPMADRIGVYLGQRKADRVKVLFSMLGRETAIYIRESDLTPA